MSHSETSKTASHDHDRCIHNAITTAEQLCLQRGVQLTPIRHKVLELIWNSHKAIKAYDLLDQIRPSKEAAKPATIYRALDFLLEQGLIHRVESLNAFVGCKCSGTQHDQVLLICTQCHTVEERSSLPVLNALADELQTAQFIAQRKTLEVQGLCHACQNTN